MPPAVAAYADRLDDEEVINPFLGHSAETDRPGRTEIDAMKQDVLDVIRHVDLARQSVWSEIQKQHPGATVFAIGAAADGLVLCPDGSFAARVSALLQVPAKRANGTRDTAPVTVPLDIRGSDAGSGKPICKDIRLATPPA